MPYAENEGVRIYFETEGTAGAPAVVMHHGFLADLESWRERGFVEMLRDRFQILLMDSRGHGRSDKPRDPEAYDLRTRVMDVVSVLNASDVRQAHYLGYSMGGMIGFSTMIYAPQRFLSYTLGGAQPMFDSDRAARSSAPFAEYYQGALKRNDAVRAAYEAGRHDVQALEACRGGSAAWGGAEQAVRLAKQPILLYVGTNDTPHAGALRARELNSNLSVIELEGDDHSAAATRSSVVGPRMLEMIEAIPVA
ncbi:MAG: alpha/beta fold hydrolase [Dehalococcoidia bacterium]